MTLKNSCFEQFGGQLLNMNDKVVHKIYSLLFLHRKIISNFLEHFF